jgi:hypothetical protein
MQNSHRQLAYGLSDCFAVNLIATHSITRQLEAHSYIPVKLQNSHFMSCTQQFLKNVSSTPCRKYLDNNFKEYVICSPCLRTEIDDFQHLLKYTVIYNIQNTSLPYNLWVVYTLYGTSYSEYILYTVTSKSRSKHSLTQLFYFTCTDPHLKQWSSHNLASCQMH